MAHDAASRRMILRRAAIVLAGAMLVSSCGGASTDDADAPNVAATAVAAAEPTEVTVAATATAPPAADDPEPAPDGGDAAGEPAADRIVVNTMTGGLYLVGADGDDRVDLASDPDVTAIHPVWRPDGRRIAWSVADDDGFAIVSADADGSDLRRRAAPFGGYFGYWDPTSSRLAFLGASPPGTGLLLDDGAVDGDPAPVVDADSFYFFSWKPDGTQWIVHSGSGFRIVDLDGTSSTLELAGGAFRSPVWADDGTIYLVVAGPGENAVVRVDPVNQTIEEVFVGGDDTNVVLDPTGRFLAVQAIDVVSDDDDPAGEETGIEASVVVIELETGERREAYDNVTGGLWWSPDGTTLAIVAPVGGGTGLVRWRVWRPDEVFETEPFRLTQIYTTAYLPFFDQFAQSVTPWSPDSSRFVYAGFDADDQLGVFVQRAEPDTSPTRIADDGILAFWSPT